MSIMTSPPQVIAAQKILIKRRTCTTFVTTHLFPCHRGPVAWGIERGSDVMCQARLQRFSHQAVRQDSQHCIPESTCNRIFPLPDSPDAPRQIGDPCSIISAASLVRSQRGLYSLTIAEPLGQGQT